MLLTKTIFLKLPLYQNHFDIKIVNRFYEIYGWSLSLLTGEVEHTLDWLQCTGLDCGVDVDLLIPRE